MKITESDKLAIIAARAAGVPVSELASRYRVSRQTISTVLGKLKDARHQDARDEFNATVYRSKLRRKGYEAVEAGLDCDADPYKRGNLGVAALKGIGEFASDQADVNVFLQSIMQLPADMRDEYLFPDDVVEVEGLAVREPDSNIGK